MDASRHRGHNYGFFIKRLFARIVLFVSRYRVVNRPPEGVPVSVLVAAPHTSNWDFPLMLAMGWLSGLTPRWLGKQEMFAGPFRPFLKALGGVPVDREDPGSLVADLVAHAGSSESLALLIPAEGTRAKGEYWKSGFYRIARDANIPIVLSYLDGPTKTGGFGPVINPTDDAVADMDLIRAFYADKGGVKPVNKTEPRFKDEATL